MVTDWSQLTLSLDALIEAIPSGPVSLIGHSFGAHLALDLARALTASHQGRLKHAFFGARPWPGLPISPVAIDTLSDEALLDLMTHQYGGAGPAMDDPAIRDVALPILRADLQLLQSYQYRSGTKLSCPLSVLYGEDDPLSQRTDYKEWAQETTSNFTRHAFQAGHLFHMTHAEKVVNWIVTSLRPES